VALEDEEALAECVLVAIDGEPPVRALPDLVAGQRATKKAVYGEPLLFLCRIRCRIRALRDAVDRIEQDF